ncbi:MAG: alpha/beta hydrolase [Acidobacteriota bacterium]
MTETSKITFGYSNVGDVKLHYATAGSGEKLVVLLHGFPEFWYSWRHQIVELSDEYTVVAPDMRGYNLSDRPKRVADYDLSLLVEDIAGLIKHFGRENAAVIGHDWGAVVAWSFAGKHPELLWKLAALQVPPWPIWRRNLTLRQLLASWYMFYFQIPFIPEFFGSLADYSMLVNAITKSTAEPDVFSPGEIAEYKKAWSQPGALTAMINYYRANMAKRFLGTHEPVAKIVAPTLFIYGEKDRAVMPTTARNVRDFVDGRFTEVRIPNKAHWIQQEARDEVTDVLRKFLAD